MKLHAFELLGGGNIYNMTTRISLYFLERNVTYNMKFYITIKTI